MCNSAGKAQVPILDHFNAYTYLQLNQIAVITVTLAPSQLQYSIYGQFRQ